MPMYKLSGVARIQLQEPWEFRGALIMQNVHYTTELLHVLSTGLGEAHNSRKALPLIFSFSWKSTANYSG